MFDLEDMNGLVRCIVWPEEYANFSSLVEADAVLVVRGAVDRRPGSEETNLVVNELIPLDDLPHRFTKGIVLRLNENQHSREDVVRLREVLRGYPGNCEVQFQVWLKDGSRVSMRSDKLRVSLDAEMRTRIDDLLGPGNLRLVAAPPKPGPPAPRNGAGRGAPARR
jgi:DNA polymerase-3 subunit alpha